MLSANLIFGINTPIAKTVLATGMISSASLTFMRMMGGALLFWIASLFIKREQVPIKDIGVIFIASLVGVQINQVAFLAGLSMTSPIDASLVVTLVPILTMLFSALYLKEPITWLKGVGVATGATGALILILQAAGASKGQSNLFGNLLCMLSATSFALYLTLFKRIITTYHPITLMKWIFFFSALCCSPFFYQDVAEVDFAQLPWGVLLKAAYVVVCATFIAYLLVPIGQRYLRPTVVSMYNYLQPLVAAIFAIVLSLDTMNWKKGVAALLVCTGVYLVTRSKSKASQEEEKVTKSVSRT